MSQQLILVDEYDTVVWYWEKLSVHQTWILHRAFSVYIFDNTGRILLQRRAMSKYHSPWLRANTCCSHPFPHESTLHAAQRRLWEEMWFDCEMTKVCEFVYQVDVPPWLIEHEYLHVYVWTYTWHSIVPDPQEVMEYKRYHPLNLDTLVQTNDPTLAPWTRITRPKISSHRTIHVT